LVDISKYFLINFKWFDLLPEEEYVGPYVRLHFIYRNITLKLQVYETFVGRIILWSRSVVHKNLTSVLSCVHCFQHIFFEHLFNWNYNTAVIVFLHFGLCPGHNSKTTRGINQKLRKTLSRSELKHISQRYTVCVTDLCCFSYLL